MQDLWLSVLHAPSAIITPWRLGAVRSSNHAVEMLWGEIYHPKSYHLLVSTRYRKFPSESGRLSSTAAFGLRHGGFPSMPIIPTMMFTVHFSWLPRRTRVICSQHLLVVPACKFSTAFMPNMRMLLTGHLMVPGDDVLRSITQSLQFIRLRSNNSIALLDFGLWIIRSDRWSAGSCGPGPPARRSFKLQPSPVE